MAESESFADVVELISSKLNVLNAKHASELDAEKSVAAVLRRDCGLVTSRSPSWQSLN